MSKKLFHSARQLSLKYPCMDHLRGPPLPHKIIQQNFILLINVLTKADVLVSTMFSLIVETLFESSHLLTLHTLILPPLHILAMEKQRHQINLQKF